MDASASLVLVVDDRAGVLHLAEKVLRSQARVLLAQGGREAIRILQHIEVAVVLCDLEMPGTHGLDVLRAVRRLQPAASFILMTAGHGVASAADAKRLGADDYLRKPFEPKDLRTVVERGVGFWGRSGPVLGLALLGSEQGTPRCSTWNGRGANADRLAGEDDAIVRARAEGLNTGRRTPAGTTSMAIPFTQDQREALAWNADKHGVTIRDLVHEAVHRAGFFQKG